MAITDEEAEKIKEHLLGQLENFPEEKRSQIKQQIESMTTEQVDNFIQQNQLTHLGGQCIFCSIIAGKNPAIKIGENSKNIAILELNPLSKGHTLIVPTDHSDTLQESSKELANQISDKLKEKFSPKDVKINEIEIMNHKMIEVVPLYGDEKERYQATESGLRLIQEEILKPSESPETTKEKKPFKITKIRPRIP